MKRPLLLSALFGCALLVAGCALTGPRTKKQAEPAKKAERVFPERRADVLVEGDYRSTTPGTIRIRRGFGERYVALHENGKPVRAFRVEPIYTSVRSDMAYFDLNPTGPIDVQDLPTDNDTLYTIPYFSGPIEIVDREFDLTLIVAN